MFSRQFKAVFKNSFTICTGDPFFLVINLSMVALMLVISSMPSLGHGESVRLIRDQTHSLIFICTALAGAMGLIRVVTDDIRRGAGSILMSRPISGAVLLIGKLAGVLTALLLMYATGGAAYLWLTEVHFIDTHMNVFSVILFIVAILASVGAGAARHYMFESNFSKYTSFSLSIFMVLGVMSRYLAGDKSHFDINGLSSLVFLFFAIIVFCSVVLVIAVIADSAMVLTGAVIVFFGGLLSEYFLQNVVGETMGGYVSSFVPNWQNFWILEQLGLGQNVEMSYFLMCAGQSVLMSGFYIILALMLFDRIEIKGMA